MRFEYAHRLVTMLSMAMIMLAAVSGCGRDASMLTPANTDSPQTEVVVTEAGTAAPTTVPDTIASVPDTTAVSGSAAPSTTEGTLGTPNSVTTATTTLEPAGNGADEVTWLLPPQRASQVEELMAVVEALRQREFPRHPDVETTTPEEGTTRPREGLGWLSPEQIEQRLALAELLGMPYEGDLETILDELKATGYEPFYDFERKVIVLPEGIDPLDEYQKWVLVGVLARALTQQRFPSMRPDRGSGDIDPDAATARIAVLEGEVILIQSLYLDSLPPEQRAEVAELARQLPRTPLDAMPPMLREGLVFPYRAGAFMVVDLYRLGGSEALDQAFERPPDTTEQILHLDKFRRLESAAAIEPVSVAADGYVLLQQGIWGEHRWRALLENYSGAVEASRAAAGWGGDHYQIHGHPLTGDLLFVARYAGDSFAEEAEMNTAIRMLLSSGLEAGPPKVVDTITEWGTGVDYALLSWDVDAITLVIASDPTVGRMIVAQLGIPI